MNNLSLDSHLVFIKDQIEWCEGCVIDRDENDNPICVRNYCNLYTAKYWLDMFIELEKDLGCPLEVVFKLIGSNIILNSEPCYVMGILKDGDNLCIHYSKCYGAYDDIEPLSNYGKTFLIDDEDKFWIDEEDKAE